MSALITLPIIVPLITLIATVAVARHQRIASIVSYTGATINLLVAILIAKACLLENQILVTWIGGWKPLIGITWATDGLSALMILLSASMSFATLVYAHCGLDRGISERFYLPLHHALICGVNGCFITADLFNLFVFFEIMILSSFGLLSLGSNKTNLQKSFPYIVINLVLSTIFLASVGVVYATSGVVNLAELSKIMSAQTMPPIFWSAMYAVIAVFCIKSALAPIYFWLPDSYPQAPLPVSALFAGLLTKVGVYALFRTVPLLANANDDLILSSLLVISGLTMALGVVGALGRTSMREIFAFHIVSQVGYMVFGLALYTSSAMAASMFYIAHHIVVKTCLFFAAGLTIRIAGSDSLEAVTGLSSAKPIAAIAFALPALSLAGIPPFSGFWAKLLLIMAGFKAESWATTTIAILVGFLTLASMLKIWNAIFWGRPKLSPPSLSADRGMYIAAFSLAGISLALGITAPGLMSIAQRTADQILAVDPYVQAILNHGNQESMQDDEDDSL